MITTAHDLPAILEAHRLWLRGEGGSRANLSGADNIVAFGPVGAEKRIGYAVRHDNAAMVKLGCFWGNQKDALDAIDAKYGPRSKYAALVRAACACLMEKK